MALIDGLVRYDHHLELPGVDLDHLYPESPYVLAQVEISLLVEHRFIDCLHDGTTRDLGCFLNSEKHISCTFVLRNFFVKEGATCRALAERLLSLEIHCQVSNRMIREIISCGRQMYERATTMNRKVMPLHLSITKEQEFYVNFDRYFTHWLMRESEAELERRNYGMIPASMSAMGRLLKRVRIVSEDRPAKRRWTSDEESPQNCTICLEELRSDAISMPCSHLFHGGCIFRWLNQSHYCPVCRHEMPTH